MHRTARCSSITFVANYPAASARLEGYYNSCRASATEVRQLTPEKQVVYLFQFARRGDQMKQTWHTGGETEGEEVDGVLISDQGNYYLKKFPKTDAFVITGTPSDREQALGAMRLAMLPAFAPYCIGRERFLDFAKAPEFSFTGAEARVDEQGMELIRLSWRSPHRENDVQVNRWGWVDLVPALDWSIRAYDWSLGFAEQPFVRSNRAEFQYAETTDGMPVIRKVQSWTEVGEKRQRVNESHFEEVVLERAMLPDKEFSLASFGIEEGIQPYNRTWLYVNIVAVILLLAAILLRRRATSKAT